VGQRRALYCFASTVWRQAQRQRKRPRPRQDLSRGQCRLICCGSRDERRAAVFWKKSRFRRRDWVELSKALKRPHVLATTRLDLGPFGRYAAGQKERGGSQGRVRAEAPQQ